jgi:hypothetical protein
MAKASVEPLSVRGAKATYYISNEAKYKLTVLKAEMRKRGLSASESSIVDILLLDATPDTVARHLRGRK